MHRYLPRKLCRKHSLARTDFFHGLLPNYRTNSNIFFNGNCMRLSSSTSQPSTVEAAEKERVAILGMPLNDNKGKGSDKEKDDGPQRPRMVHIALASILCIYLLCTNIMDLRTMANEKRKNVLLQDEFVACQLISCTQVNKDSFLYTIRARNKMTFGSGSAGSGGNGDIPWHIDIKDDSCQVARSYTPVSATEWTVSLLIKHYPDGVISRMLKNTEVGGDVLIRGPIATMPQDYKRNGVDNIAMIAGGTGITPMYQLIRRILLDNLDNTKVSLYYLNKTRDDILMRRELEVLENRFPDKFKVTYALDGEKVSSLKLQGNEKGLKLIQGVSTATLKSFLPFEPEDKRFAILVCGPEGLITYVAGKKGAKKDDQGQIGGLLASLGFNNGHASQIYKF